jgi:ribose 1,5-bisphosphokinase PhnN
MAKQPPSTESSEAIRAKIMEYVRMYPDGIWPPEVSREVNLLEGRLTDAKGREALERIKAKLAASR